MSFALTQHEHKRDTSGPAASAQPAFFNLRLMKGHYTAAELETLRRTGIIPGRTRRSIQNARTKLALRQPRALRSRWTEEEKQKLAELFAQGFSALLIARRALLPRSLMSIQKQLRRMGLSKRMPIKRLSVETRDLLKSFLRAHFANRTPRELTEIWNEQCPEHALNKRSIVSYLTRLGLKMPYAEVIRLERLKKRERALQLAAAETHENLQTLQEKIRRERARVLRARLARGRDLWTGLQLSPEELTDGPAENDP